jgi:serine/threonine-protein kinase
MVFHVPRARVAWEERAARPNGGNPIDDTLLGRMTTIDRPDRPPEVVPGQVVGGKWRIVAPLGRGGMGAVYEGQNISIGKRVALKFIDAEFARQPDLASRFQREAEAASLVESAHIVHIFDSGTTETGLPYIVMELLRGEDLRARLRRMGRLPHQEAVHIVAQTLRGLHRAHEAGIVHRDLKPDNIFLVDRDDDPLFAKIVDFGISKMARRPGTVDTGTLTRQGVVLGTPFYMSPEQAQALPNLDLRTDLWSVGAILYECLTGKPPHGGDAYEQIIISICTTDAPPLQSIDASIPEQLAGVVHRALSRDPARRFQSAREMLDALVATGIDTPSLATLTPRTVVQAPAFAVPPESGNKSPPEGAGTRTRVSWTRGEPKPAAIQATVSDAIDPRLSRARVVRRRGLVLLGGAVMLAAFVLTSGFLRAGRTPRASANEIKTTDTVLGPSSAPLATGVMAEAPKAEAQSTAEQPAPSPRAPTPAQPAASRAKKPVPPSAALPAAPAVPSPPTPASASSVKAGGVAGGLQIKTTYP